MTTQERELDPGASARHFYGAEVRRLRGAAGMSIAQLGAIVSYSKSQMARIETAERPSNLALSQALDIALSTDGHFERLWALVRRERFPLRYRRVLELQEQALRIGEYAVDTVPGLLQTEEYARAMMRVGLRPADTGQLEDRVAARMERQALLARPRPPHLWAVLEEAVIRRPVGGDAVMRRQLERLLRTGGEPHVQVQVLPISAGEHMAMGSALTLLRLPDGSDTAYLESGFDGRFVEDPEDVARFQLTYDELRANALPPKQSLALIETVMEVSFPCPCPSETSPS